jgi:NADH-quinone oxidoreductase subunit F
MNRVIRRIMAGQGNKSDLQLLVDVAGRIEGHTICALGDAAAWPIQGLIRHFRPELERRIVERRGESSFAQAAE